MVKEVIPAGVAAAMQDWLYQERNIRSTKCITVIEAVVRIRG